MDFGVGAGTEKMKRESFLSKYFLLRLRASEWFLINIFPGEENLQAIESKKKIYIFVRIILNEIRALEIKGTENGKEIKIYWNRFIIF